MEQTPAPNSDVLKAKVLSAIKWSAFSRLGVQVVSWAMTLVTVRLLSPSDYGILAMATIFTTFLALLNELGLGAAVVQARELTTNALRLVGGYVYVVNAACFLALVLASPLVATFFEEPRLLPVIPVLGLQFIIGAPSVIPRSLLVRNLHFRTLSIIEIIGRLVDGLSTIGLALAGQGIWALVGGTLLGEAVRAVAFVVTSEHVPVPSFGFKGMRQMVTFGGAVAIQRIIWFFYSQADDLIIGKLLGRDMLGYYSISMHLASLPMQKLNAVISQVTLPTFSQLRSLGLPIEFYAQKAVRLLSLIAFPVFFGISAVAPEIVEGILGPKWRMSTLPLQVLSIVMPFRMVSNPISEIVNAVGAPGVVVANLAVLMTCVVPALLAGSHWGIAGVSIAWLISYPIAFVVTNRRACHVIGVPPINVFKAMARPGLAVTVMYTIVTLTRALVPVWMGPIPKLALLSIVGASVFTGVIFLLYRDGVEELLTFARTRKLEERSEPVAAAGALKAGN